MLSLFKKKNPKEKLQAKYEKCMSDWHKLSQTNRSAADAKYKEAEDILAEIERLDNAN